MFKMHVLAIIFFVSIGNITIPSAENTLDESPISSPTPLLKKLSDDAENPSVSIQVQAVASSSAGIQQISRSPVAASDNPLSPTNALLHDVSRRSSASSDGTSTHGLRG